MPRKHSTLGLMNDHRQAHQLVLMWNGLKQHEEIIVALASFINNYIIPQYITWQIEGEMDKLEAYIDANDSIIKKKLLAFERSAYNMENRSMFTLADYVIKSLLAINQTTTQRRLLQEYTTKISVLEEIIENSGTRQAVYEAPIQTELTASVELDIRYLFYIKKYGAPENGIFDPVLLSEFVYTEEGRDISANDTMTQAEFDSANYGD